jgi:hypothetical protein
MLFGKAGTKPQTSSYGKYCFWSVFILLDILWYLWWRTHEPTCVHMHICTERHRHTCTQRCRRTPTQPHRQRTKEMEQNNPKKGQKADHNYFNFFSLIHSRNTSYIPIIHSLIQFSITW